MKYKYTKAYNEKYPGLSQRRQESNPSYKHIGICPYCNKRMFNATIGGQFVISGDSDYPFTSVT